MRSVAARDEPAAHSAMPAHAETLTRPARSGIGRLTAPRMPAVRAIMPVMPGEAAAMTTDQYK